MTWIGALAIDSISLPKWEWSSAVHSASWNAMDGERVQW